MNAMNGEYLSDIASVLAAGTTPKDSISDFLSPNGGLN
jgi:hypothetical protein